jgi:hypothetical protein
MIEFKLILIFSKKFLHIVTNALLIDVLAFRQYLIYGVIPDEYLKKIEEAVVSVVSCFENQD